MLSNLVVILLFDYIIPIVSNKSYLWRSFSTLSKSLNILEKKAKLAKCE
jgi:hypothetical protein